MELLVDLLLLLPRTSLPIYPTPPPSAPLCHGFHSSSPPRLVVAACGASMGGCRVMGEAGESAGGGMQVASLRVSPSHLALLAVLVRSHATPQSLAHPFVRTLLSQSFASCTRMLLARAGAPSVQQHGDKRPVQQQ
jgi:hypothetical protein